MKLFTVGSILLSSFLLWVSAAQAEIAISPMVIETQVKRGQTQGSITVYNQDPQDFRARVYTAPFTYDREQGFQELKSSPNDLGKYIQFSPRELEVPGTRKRRIRFTVLFPPSLPDGEYRTMIFTENLQTSTVTETDKANGVTLLTSIVPRIGVTVYVRKGNIAPKLMTASARINPKSNKIELLVQNQGKATAIVAGNWTLKQGKQVIQQGTISDTTIIAEGERFVSVNLPKEKQLKLAPGVYQFSGELGWGENKNNKVPFNINLTVPN
jgi:hypothetical protein